jgi:hypothetical protein
LAAREDEVQRLLTEREARRQEPRNGQRAWRWRIEPGKEAEFEYLRSWLLPGLPEGPTDVATSRPDLVPAGRSDARPAHERVTTPRRLSPVRLGARLAGRAAVKAGRRLLQWGDAADETETSAA